MTFFSQSAIQEIPTQHARTRDHVLVLLGIFVSTALFAASFDNGFRDDDFVFLRHVTSHHSLASLTSPETAQFAFFRPGAYLLFAAEHALFGFDAGLYVLFNRLLHGLNVWLMFVLLVALRMTPRTAVLAAFLYAVGYGHYSKQVMWACTSGPIFAVTLSLVGLVVLFRFTHGATRVSRPGVAIATATWGLALTFHEAAVVTPALGIAIFWILSRSRPMKLARELWPTLLPVLTWLAILAVMSRQYHDYQIDWMQLRAAVWLVFRYPGFMLFPIQASQFALAFPIQLFLSCAVLATLATLAWRGVKPARVYGVWLLLALLPFAFVGLPGRWLEMRYLYNAAMPLAALTAILWFRVVSNRSRLAKTALCTAGISFLLLSVAFQWVLERKYDAFAKETVNTTRLQELRDVGNTTPQRPGV